MSLPDKPDRELELKLAVPAGSTGAILHHPALRLSEPDAEQRHQVTTYFDTAEQTLAHCGITLRVRYDGRARVQTVKADRRASLAADRAEWEWPIASDRPDLGLLAQTPVADRLPASLDLQPLVTTDITRTLRTLTLDGGSLIEAAFDEGAIIAGAVREPVREFELELRRGDPAAVYRLALMLHASVPVTIQHETKAERGYRLAKGAVPAARKATSVALTAVTPGAEAFREILASGLHHLLANRPAALAGDAEGLHQMRVAIRRLRAALALFKPYLEHHALARFEAELHRVGQIFGEARDWDVFCLQVLPQTLGASDTVGWRDLLLPPATEHRDAAYRRVAQEIDAPAFTALALGLAAWAEQGRGSPHLLGDAALEQSITRLCPSMLDPLAHKVARRGRHIDASDAERHALRKSVKKLRYAIDYVAGAHPHEAVKSYLRVCKKLQQCLGDINDTVAATGLAERLAGESRPDLAPALGALGSILAARRDDALRELPKRWRKFEHERRFWA